MAGGAGGLPTSRLFMVEPLPNLAPVLRKKSKNLDESFVPCLLSDQDGRDEIFYLGSIGSSIYKPKRFAPNERIKRRARTLDSICSEELALFPDIIKIDVQGAEQAVMAGGDNSIKYASVVIIEMSIVNSYEKGLLAGEMIELMSSLGFLLYDIAGTNRANRTRSVTEFDAVFVRRGHSLWDLQAFLP